MKKKIIPVLIVVVLIAVVGACIFISSLIQKYTPTTERADLSTLYPTATDDQAAIILNNTVSRQVAKRIDGQLYLDFDFVHDTLNSRFYWDENENILLYATPDDLISAQAEATSYQVTKSSVDFKSIVVKATADSALIHIDFVKKFCNFTYEYFEAPSRVVMYTKWGEYDTITVSKDTELRVKGGIKSPILVDLAEGDVLYVLDREENWIKAMTSDGIIGYARNKFLGSEQKVSITNEFEEEVFSHITRSSQICMAWHQVFDKSANGDVASVLAGLKGVNVISPTWFYLNNNEGGLKDLASLDYVNYCHQQGYEVWPTVNNIENKDVDCTYVLTHTSVRHNLVNQIVSLAIQYNLDGINLDFEALDREGVGESYIQFIRELSLKCANNGIILSVDNYVPTDYTDFYNRAEQAKFADYIVIMAYDEHFNGSEPGSVASLSWVREGIQNTLKEVPGEQIVLGIPFYTRVWQLTLNSDDSDTEMIYDVTSKAYGLRASAKLISNHNAQKVWLEDCGQFYAEFESEGSTFKIWLEDASSIDEKLRLISEYSLAGSSFWKLGLQTDEIWDTVIKYIN